MERLNRGPLDDFDEQSLLRLLGDAWLAQVADKNKDRSAPLTSLEIGEREFAAVSPMLREALHHPFYHGVSARISSVLQVEATWPIPTALIVALARRRGFIA